MHLVRLDIGMRIAEVGSAFRLTFEGQVGQ
jgi:hypothetical protein